MEEEKKSQEETKIFLYFLVSVLLIAGIAGAVIFYMNDSFKKELGTLENRLSESEKNKRNLESKVEKLRERGSKKTELYQNALDETNKLGRQLQEANERLKKEAKSKKTATKVLKDKLDKQKKYAAKLEKTQENLKKALEYEKAKKEAKTGEKVDEPQYTQINVDDIADDLSKKPKNPKKEEVEEEEEGNSNNNEQMAKQLISAIGAMVCVFQPELAPFVMVICSSFGMGGSTETKIRNLKTLQKMANGEEISDKERESLIKTTIETLKLDGELDPKKVEKLLKDLDKLRKDAKNPSKAVKKLRQKLEAKLEEFKKETKQRLEKELRRFLKTETLKLIFKIVKKNPEKEIDKLVDNIANIIGKNSSGKIHWKTKRLKNKVKKLLLHHCRRADIWKRLSQK